MKVGPKKPNANERHSVSELEGCYIEVGHTAIRLVLEGGRYQWGSREIHDFGEYAAVRPDEFSCILELSSEPFKASKPRRTCRLIRTGKSYAVKELPDGEETKFKREDKKLVLADSLSKATQHACRDGVATQNPKQKWKRIEDSKIYYELTG